MQSNGLLKWLMLPIALLLVFVGVRLFSGNTTPPAPGDVNSQLSADEMRALGIEGDTPNDTVATLVAQVRQLRNELQTALSDNRTQQTENERLRQRERSIDQRIQSALDTERTQLRQDREQVASERRQAQSMLQDLQRQLDGLDSRAGLADLPIGLGLEEGDGQGFSRDGVRWVEPDDARPADDRSGNRSGFNFPNDFGPAQGAIDSASETLGRATDGNVGTSPLQAVYTVPSNSTLMGSIAMTALIGRVPIDGTVNDPFPFKVVIGADNLTANGIELPDVAGAVVSGTASGDWTLSCVRGQIRSITFVFEDGTVRTLPEETGRSNNGSNNTRSDNGIQGGLGWISDSYGIPCVSGERRSNAQQFLGTQALITAAGAGAASLIDADSGQVSYIGSDGSLGTVGITGNQAMGQILAGGVQDMSQWVNKLYGQAFAAVYVEPGASVAVHIEQALTIDYDAKGRRVDHQQEAPMYLLSIDRTGTERLAIAFAILILAGCATSKEELLTHDGQTMLDIWTQEAGSSSGGGRAARELLDARQALRRPLTVVDAQSAPDRQASYTRTAQNEIYSQFQRLPNPDLVMYVFPHLAGTDPVPIPGYSTVFPLYQRVQYALPGERVEDY